MDSMDKYVKEKDYNGPGVYALINVYNLSVYVGATRHINRRKKQHFADLRRNKHANKKLQECYKSGKFRFVILQKLPEDVEDFELHHLEKLFIYDFCWRSGYHVCNHEAENKERLKNLIFHEVLYNSHVSNKINEAFKNEYGVGTWNMKMRSKCRRMD